MASDFGPWAPLPIAEVVRWFAGASFPWWVTGGLALELHVGRSWRDHDDIDVGIRRADAPAAYAHLVGNGGHPSIAAASVLRDWDGRPLDAARAENNVWVRAVPGGPWVLDLTVGDGDDAEWAYRRDPAVRRRWDEVVLRSEAGVPYLAPELQLLFKSEAPRPKDHQDAEVLAPLLGPVRRAALAALLAADHPWQALLRN